MTPRIGFGTALAVLVLAGCGGKGTLENSREEFVRVEGQTYEVRIAKSDNMKDTWRLMIVRATVTLHGVDPDLARMQMQNAAKPFMDRTCKGRPYEQLMDKLQDDVNYYTLFTCRAAT